MWWSHAVVVGAEALPLGVCERVWNWGDFLEESDTGWGTAATIGAFAARPLEAAPRYSRE